MKRQANRRDFIKATAATAIACPWLIPASARGADGRAPPSGRIVMGGIGIGNQGSGDQKAYLARGDVQYVAVCDVNSERRNAARDRVHARYRNKDSKGYLDFRELLDRGDIDAVHCATPEHWHALVVIEACRQGKDVFCQKPESKTLREGALMVAAARWRYGRVVSGGSQRVLEDYRGVVDKCWSGELGPIKSINVNVGPRAQPCWLGVEAVPPGFDWDMWLGPAPWAPYHPYRCNGGYNINGTCWRSFCDYSGGGMTDWGAHYFGGAIFAIDCRELEPEEVIYHEEQGREHLAFRYPNGILLYHSHPGQGNLQVTGTPGEQRAAKPVPGYKDVGGINGDFIQCVKTRERPFRDIELAVHTMAVAHLGIIAYQLKRSLKWDAARNEFPGDEEANRLVDYARRGPWTL